MPVHTIKYVNVSTHIAKKYLKFIFATDANILTFI